MLFGILSSQQAQEGTGLVGFHFCFMNLLFHHFLDDFHMKDKIYLGVELPTLTFVCSTLSLHIQFLFRIED